MENGKLYIVATPIGNMEDITLRALETLRTVDLILCEDTRVTKNLLNHYAIKTPTLSYHEYSDSAKIKEVQELLAKGKNLALVTDAGTPGICDPGNYLIEQITKNNKETTVIPIPGSSALIAALSISGFPTDNFLFLGFPPHKKGRQTFFKELAKTKTTVVFYESSHRIQKCMTELAASLNPERKICICRELTKKFETVYRGTMTEIMTIKIPEKGEFVIIISK